MNLLLPGNKNTYRLIILLVLLLGFTSVNAQFSNRRKFQFCEVSGTIGTTHYFGDIGGAYETVTGMSRIKDFDISQTRVMVGLGFRYKPSKLLGFSLHLNPALVSGNDRYSKNASRKYRFNSVLVEGMANAELYFLRKESGINPYLTLGAGGFYYQTDTVFDIGLNDRGLGIVGMGGFGVRLETNQQYIHSLEFGLRRCFSDQIDGFQSNTNIKDVYIFLTYSYNFGIMQKSIYDRNGLLKKGWFHKRKTVKKKSKKNEVVLPPLELNNSDLSAKERRAIKRKLRKLNKKKKLD